MNDSFRVGKYEIGSSCPPFLIAEAGINHNGDVGLAFRMIKAAHETGVDAIKFQTFHTEDFVTDRNIEYTYKSQGKLVTESMFDMFKRTEFTEEEWREIVAFCDELGILFLSTPVTERDLKFLIDLGVNAVKVGSDDFTNIPLIEKYARYGLPMFVSCGMSDGDEIEAVVDAIKDINPNLCLFLCTSQYPTPPQDVNARKLLSMHERFPRVVLGLSDHTVGATAAVLASALGAKVFEKHFTLSHELPGPDHWFSSDPMELKSWVSSIREAAEMLGDASLEPTAEEMKMRPIMRRSVIALCNIGEGDTFTEKNIGLRRPGTGLPPSSFGQILGKTAARSIRIDSLIQEEDYI